MSATVPVDVLEILRIAVLDNGGKEEDLQLLALPAVTVELAKTLVRYAKLLSDVRSVTVDYGNPKNDGEREQVFTSMIASAGFDCVNSIVTVANFPLFGIGKAEEEIVVLHFNCDIGSDAAIAEMVKLGLEPARIEHACAFGEKYPDVQRKYPVVFLGSSCQMNHRRYVPCLCGGVSGRYLGLYCFDDDWNGHCLFVAVHTKKTK